MAQRGGVVESAILFGDGDSTIISDGEADIFISFEPSEALRALNKCNKNTVTITNLSPLPPFTVAIGKGEYPDIENVKKLLSEKSSRFISFDAVKLASEAGNVMSVNMVLLGALAQTGTLPFPAENIKTAIKTKTKKEFVDINLKAFDLGFAEAAK
jgi:indolepyruvate ferredoxin oxidoreductase beta subunit